MKSEDSLVAMSQYLPRPGGAVTKWKRGAPPSSSSNCSEISELEDADVRETAMELRWLPWMRSATLAEQRAEMAYIEYKCAFPTSPPLQCARH